MSFPRDEFGNTNYGPPPSNFEEAATLIPSIYSGQKKHITSTEWRDKALDWVKVKQTNEKMWNTFGISPAPKVNALPVIPQYTNVIPEKSMVQVQQSQSENLNVNVVPPFGAKIENKVPQKRKLVSNWIKSVKTTKKSNVENQNEMIQQELIEEKQNVETEMEEVNETVEYKEEMKQKYYQEKLKNIAQEFTSMIILEITTQMVEKFTKRAYELVCDNNVHNLNRNDVLESKVKSTKKKKVKHSRNRSLSNEKDAKDFKHSKVSNSKSKGLKKTKSRSQSRDSISSDSSNSLVKSNE